MYKKNFEEAAERNKRLLKRELMDGILFKTTVSENPYDVHDNEGRSEVWGDRECLAVSDKEWVQDGCRRAASVYQLIDDDTIPEAYPTLHFGEAIYSGILGGEMQMVGNDFHTCSGAKPIIHSAEDFEKIQDYKNNHWVKVFTQSASYFAAQTKGDYWLKYIISIDALNLAVELLGTTEAYFMVHDDDALLRQIMEFGVDFNEWWYLHQKSIYEKNNRAALGDNELYDLYDKTWYSIDAYTICAPEVYNNFGLEYQQELIRRVGGGMLHTHGTALMQLLPYVSKLDGLGKLQLGRDLYSQEFMGVDHLLDVRKMTKDTPLQIYVNPDEFMDGIKNKTLPGGTEYLCHTQTIEEANKLAYLAKEYRAP